MFLSLSAMPGAELSVEWGHMFWSELIGTVLGLTWFSVFSGRITLWFGDLEAGLPANPCSTLTLTSGLVESFDSITLWLWVSYLILFCFNFFLSCKKGTLIVYLKVVVRNKHTCKGVRRVPDTLLHSTVDNNVTVTCLCFEGTIVENRSKNYAKSPYANSKDYGLSVLVHQGWLYCL